MVGETEDGRQTVQAIKTLAPDVVFLDVRMPRGGGFDVVRELGAEAMPVLVFVTAFDEHAIAAFEVHALDYLLKPFAKQRFEATLARVRERIASGSGERARALGQLVGDSLTPLTHLQVDKGPNREALVRLQDVDILRADKNYVQLRTHDGQRYRCRGPLSRIVARLDPATFLPLNRSEVVRLAAVAELQPWLRGDYRVVLHGGETLVWSRRYRARYKDRFSTR